MFQGGFRDVLRKFQGGLKKVSSVFQENFIKSFKGVSSFVLQFCCSMNLIAATRAEGGLVRLGAAATCIGGAATYMVELQPHMVKVIIRLTSAKVEVEAELGNTE